MSEEQTAEEAKRYNVEKLISLFLNLLALFMIFMTVRYWMMLVGFPDAGIRFDTMPVSVRLVVTSLSILMPIAALGLWGGYRWGIAIWIVAVVIELLSYLFLPQQYQNPEMLVFSHLATFLVFCVYFVSTLRK